MNWSSSLEPVMWPAVCGNSSPFWDDQIFWNTTNPNLPECFRRTALIWIPCAFFWLFLPLEIFVGETRGRLIPWSKLNVTKLVLTGALIVVTVFDVGRNLGSPVTLASTNTLAVLLSSVLHVVTLVALFILVAVERVQGVRSSPLLFFVWLAYSICGSMNVYSLSIRDYDEFAWSQKVDYVSSLVIFVIVVGQFLLAFPNDAKPAMSNFQDTEENACPRNTASFISKVLFLWFDSLLWKGYTTQLQSKDVWKSTPLSMASDAYPRFMKYWTKQTKAGKTPSIVHALFWMQFLPYVFITCLKVIEYTLAYTNPLLLNWLIQFVSRDEPQWHGYLYVAGMLLVSALVSVVGWQCAYFGAVIQVAVQSALSSAIYRKNLTLSGSSRRGCTTGEIVNFISVDLINVTDFLFHLVDGLTLPLQIAFGIYMLYGIMGTATFVGVGCMVVLKLLSGILAKKMEWLQMDQLELKDQRVKQVNEAILGVKVLKLFAWERPFMDRIKDIRHKETEVLRRGMYYEGASVVLWIIAPAMVTLVTVVTYVLLDKRNVLDAAKIFVTLSIIQLLGASLIRLPWVIVSFVKAVVSSRRLNGFLNSQDLDTDCVTHDSTSDYAVYVNDGSFTWGSESEMSLDKINLKVKDGELVAIVGPVGCGKSSLLSAILGEMDKNCGTVNTKGKIAYVPQQAWIQNATLKDNVLFGKPLDDGFYSKVIQSCSLLPDFEILPGGDTTEIGENGINLSGGQKQRVSLARAVYNDADIYLLDDPLSAVDTHVGQHIFEHVIGPTGLLKDKTRVLVTHGLTYLPYVDHIVVICDGAISEVGSYNELMETKGDFYEFITAYGQTNATSTSARSSFHETKGEEKETAAPGAGTKLITEENLEIGEVSSSIYKLYIKYVGNWLSGVVVFFLVTAYAFSAGAQNWLSLWSSDPLLPDGSQDPGLRNLRLSVYGLLTLLFGVFLLLSVHILITGSRRASMRFHTGMLDGILHSPMSFFDTTPSGRIVNRFSEDIQSVDTQVPLNFRDLLTAVMEIATSVIVICVRLPIIIAIVIPMMIIYYVFQRFFVRTINQLRRLESIAKSPMYSRFSETIGGVATIRAFGLQSRFIYEFEDLVDEVIKLQYYRRTMFRWFGIRLDSMGGLLTLFTGLFAILARDSLTPGTIALVVSYSMSIFWIFSWLVISAGELEASVVSVERINEYICLPPEAEWDRPERKPATPWPSHGSVSFNNYATKYRAELQPVLHDVTCDIDAGEKIGVVGRTGAGKSSITMSLFRIIEALRGSIVIDGVDISTVGLHDLRSRITIIPQDPVLFSGTLRHNLDPFERHSDDDVWTALELADLKDFVSSLLCGLMHHVSEGGSNLSVGQKQLICLARALLQKNKILVLDEATAAVDLETDELIQATIRKSFSDCTVITIAHRINTIMDSNRIMVLDMGRLVEFDTPDKLLADKNSIFYTMAKQAGLVN